MTRSAIYQWLEADKKFKQAYEDQIEALIDFAESNLLKSMQNGSDTATIFFLKCRGKKRGYIERSEITGADGQPLIPAKDDPLAPITFNINVISQKDAHDIQRTPTKDILE